jgi:hypothetical protein
MYRLSGAVRRAERCIHWRSLLGDAASTQAQQAAPAAFAEASRQGAASLVRSMATRCSRAHSTHAAGAEQSAVVCACVLERLPIVLPPQPAWELEYQARRLAAAVTHCGTYGFCALRPRVPTAHG